MNILLENPLPIIAGGAVLATLCGLVFLSRRTVPALLALAVVVLLTLLLVVTEKLIITPREEVEQALSALLAAVESNELPDVLALLDVNGQVVRMDAEALMQKITVEDTGATAISINIDEGTSPLKATSRCKGRLRGVYQSGAAFFYLDQVEFRWIKRDDRWLLLHYVVYQNGKPLDAVINVLRAEWYVPAR